MNPPGFNPINWNCIVSGCYNYHRHYDIEHLAAQLPRNIGFTDLDGFVEVGGHFLITEFKAKNADTTAGQRIAFERLTAALDRMTVLIIRCDYTTSEIFALRVIRGGENGAWRPCTYEQFLAYLRQWVERVQREAA